MRKTVNDIKNRVVRLVGDVSNDGKARALEFLNDAQEYIQAERHWSFLHKMEDTITLVADTDTYNTPTGMYSISRMYYTNSQGEVERILTPVEDKDYLKFYEGQTSGNPSVYRMLDYGSNYQSRVQIGVAPSAQHISTFGSALYIEQNDQLTALTTDSQYPDLPFDFTKCLEFLAASLMCQSQGDMAQAAGYMATYQALMSKLKIKDLTRYGKTFREKPTDGPAPWRNRRRNDYR